MFWKKYWNRLNKEEIYQYGFFLVVSIIIMVLWEPDRFWHDSLQYFELGQGLYETGFAIGNFEHGVRGIWYPLLLSPFFIVKKAWLIPSVLLLIFFVCVFPRVWISSNKVDFKSRCILFCLLLFFWNGLFRYPMSDAVALSLLLVGMMLCFGKHQIISPFLGGACLYICYNTRTIYLFPIIVFVILYCVYLKEWKAIFCFILCFFVGFLCGAIPQIIVNYNNYSILSIKVITNRGYGNGLFSWQLAEGIRHTQYETFVGTEDVYPKPNLRFNDVVGMQIFAKEGLDPTQMNIKDVIKVIIKYPLDVAGIYVRHFINMLNPIWGEEYIEDIHKIKIHYTIVNYFMMCTFMTWFISRKIKMRDFINKYSKKLILGIAMLIPCFAITPGYVEQRFYFPMYYVFYLVMIFVMGKSGFKEVIYLWKKRPCLYICVWGFVFLVFCAIWSVTLASTQYGVWIGLL